MDLSTRPAAAPSATATPSAGRASIPGHDNLASTTIFRGAAILLGLPFLGIGAFIALMSADVIHVPDSSFHAPRWLVGAIGVGTFGAAGAMFIGHGLRGVVRQRAAARARRLSPDAPWRFDRTWGRGGEDAPRWSRAVKAVFGALFFCLFFAIGIAVVFTTGAPDVVRAGSILFSAIALIPLWLATRRVIEAVRYGRTYVRWKQFPAFVGERIDLEFGVTKDHPRFSRLTFRLRCVEERVVESSTYGRNRTSSVAAFTLHDQKIEITDPAKMPRPRAEAAVAFDVPAGLPGNALDRDLPTYWELDVTGEAPGVDYRMRFMLPVYAKR